MQDFVVDLLSEESNLFGVKVFVKSMNFAKYYGNESEIIDWIMKSIKMFLKAENFIGVGIKGNINTKNSNYVGFASLIPVKNSGWIPYVGVSPEYQGLGLGKQLMHRIFEIAEKLQLKSIELCSSQKGVNFYRSLGFESNYPVSGYDVKETWKKPSKELHIDTEIPEWVYQMDQEVGGIDRRKLFHIHNYNQIMIINEPYHGYGILYKTRIGPIIADSLELAQEIILKAIELGATSLVLVEDSPIKKAIHDVVGLTPQPLVASIKMTYGIPLNQDLTKIFGLRSVAYG